AAKKIRRIGAKNIIITGYAIGKNKIADFVHDGKKQYLIPGEKIPGTSHGGGCNFAFAVAFNIGSDKDVFDAAKNAKGFTLDAIRHSRQLGKGIKITAPKMDEIKKDLSQAVQKFTHLKNASSLIPEVQTNFVFAKKNPRSIDDIVGVSGRIVKARDSVIVAGSIEYGGSRHIGTAVLTMQKRFSQMRSAINIKFDEKTVKRFQRAKLKVLSYDRSQEPIRSKLKENSTVSWGIHHAIQNQSHPPDAVYHRGDVGKEPMIIIFGKTPKHVLEKLKKII
ncbi:MAG TPA: thiamine-phosphate synthase family protein, partial [Candidatus Nitrosotenuis sp.]|nr:thiamine-phosphate synthase family protein [Candidatus Nitrosotenuis sp.]